MSNLISSVGVFSLVREGRLQGQKQAPECKTKKITYNISCDHLPGLDKSHADPIAAETRRDIEQNSKPRRAFPCTSAPPIEQGVGLLPAATDQWE